MNNITENFGSTLNNTYHLNMFQTTTEIPTESTLTTIYLDNTNSSFTDSPTGTSINNGTYSEDNTKNQNNSVVSPVNIFNDSEKIFGETTLQNNITELNNESTYSIETYTQQNELENFTANINNPVMPYNDIYMDKYNSTNSNIYGITKEESSISTTMKSEKSHNVETNTQHQEFTNLTNKPHYSEIFEYETNTSYSIPNVLNTIENATDKNKENITDFNHLSTLKSTAGFVNTSVTSHIFNGDNNLFTPISTFQYSNTTDSTICALNETTTIYSNSSENIHVDEINVHDVTTPYFNNFTFYLPTTNRFHTKYIPIRVLPLFTFSQIN